MAYQSPWTGLELDDVLERVQDDLLFPRVANIAAAQAMTKVQMAKARVVIVLGLNDAYDGLGGNMFNYESALSGVDDGISLLRPSNYDGTGVLKKFGG